jgi:hypothetical protein
MKLKIAYLKWRDGRPRWEPGPGLRNAGFKGCDLRDAGGAWLPLDLAIQEAQKLNKEVEAWRAGGAPRTKAEPPRVRQRTCRQLFLSWAGSADKPAPEFSKLAPTTQAFYRLNAKLFLDDFGEEPVAALTTPILYGYWEDLYEKRGHHMANQILATARVMLTHARKRLGWIEHNPALGLGLMQTEARLVLWLPKQVELFVATADRLNLHSIGDAVITGLHTAQRQGDVLSLPVHIFTKGRIALSQAKTKALIDAPMTPAMRDRVTKILDRRKLGEVTRVDTLILREDGTRYDKRSFNRGFCEVRAEAAKEDSAMLGLKYLDLRDTAVTRLALAECTMAEIAAITGHSLKTIQSIMKHYLVMQPEMADAAIRKLTRWMEREGVAL